MAIVALGLLAVYFFAAQTERFVTRGKVLSAKVEDVRNAGTSSRPSYYVDYSYTFDRYRYSGSEKLSTSDWGTLTAGDSVPVTILIDSPSEHRYGRITDQDVQEARRIGSLFVLVPALLFLLLAFEVRHRVWKQSRILSLWRALPAQMIEVKRIWLPNNREMYTASFRVRLPDGKVVVQERHWTQASSFDLAVGDIFPVLVPPKGRYGPSHFTPRWTLTAVEIAPGEGSEGTLSP